MSTKKVVSIIAPPGAGKGTQAEILARDLGFVHIETSKIIRKKFTEADPNDSVIKREKEKYAAGFLNDSKLVDEWMTEEITRLGKEKKDIVFSGWPRLPIEAETAHELFPKFYKKENIKFFHITLSEDESVKRNAHRLVCEKNDHPFPGNQSTTLNACPFDGSLLITRGSLDAPEMIRKRYAVYKSETKPLFKVIKKNGHQIIEINGEQSIEAVAAEIRQHLEV